jgi:hypothetical protein
LNDQVLDLVKEEITLQKKWVELHKLQEKEWAVYEKMSMK